MATPTPDESMKAINDIISSYNKDIDNEKTRLVNVNTRLKDVANAIGTFATSGGAAVEEINKQLESLAVQLVEEIDRLEVTDAYLNAELQKQRSEINSHLDNLSSDRTTLQRLDNNYVTITAQQDDSKLKYTAENYEFMAWGLTALAIGGITFRQIMKTK